MSIEQQKASCVLRFKKCEFIITVQRDYQQKFSVGYYNSPKYSKMV